MEEKKQKNKFANEVGTKGVTLRLRHEVSNSGYRQALVPDLRFGSAPKEDFAKSDTVAILIEKGYLEHQNEVCACGIRTSPDRVDCVCSLFPGTGEWTVTRSYLRKIFTLCNDE